MSDLSLNTASPVAMPVLSRGKHRDPARGACFMEYTSVLAGEPFTDAPRCTDGELAAVLRGANDKLSDADRHLLLPLLGRAIGLAVERPTLPSAWSRSAAARRRRRHLLSEYRRQTVRLRSTAARRFLDALGSPLSPSTMLWCGEGEEIAWLFWDLMAEPPFPALSGDYVRRLLTRLELLHECYEQAMDDVGLPRAVPTVSVPTEPRTPVSA